MLQKAKKGQREKWSLDRQVLRSFRDLSSSVDGNPVVVNRLSSWLFFYLITSTGEGILPPALVAPYISVLI